MKDLDDTIEVLGNTEEIENLVEETNNFEEFTNTEVVNDLPIDKEESVGSETEGKSPEETPKNNKYVSFEVRILRLAIILVICIGIALISLIGYNRFKNDKYYFNENSSAYYQVCLNDNEYYEDNCLSEGMEYISTLTDKINVDFNYNAVFQIPREGKYKYFIKGTITVQNDEDNKTLYTKEQNLTKKSNYVLTQNVVSMSDTVQIPYDQVNKYAQKYLNDYGLINKVNYKVSFIVDDGIQEKEVSSIVIPLTKQTYSITKDELKNQSGELLIKSENWIQYIFLGLLVLSIIPIVICIIRILYYVSKFSKNSSIYKKKLNEILSTYDRVIITGKDNNIIAKKDNIYEVKTFFELLDVRDTIDKPILYYKINDIKSEFYVQDVDTTYKFTLKESDFEEK
ncbi:MAG: hypothetical protein IKH54_01220 [Bacilli bacterium]|nr:hypothetical protein [Bacilli bacterium]